MNPNQPTQTTAGKPGSTPPNALNGEAGGASAREAADGKGVSGGRDAANKGGTSER